MQVEITALLGQQATLQASLAESRQAFGRSCTARAISLLLEGREGHLFFEIETT